jgi:hypothetical protein
MQSNKDIILVLDYPTKFAATQSGNTNGVMCHLQLHIPEEKFNPQTLDYQPVLMFLIERTIKEIKDSFLQT